MQFSDTTTNLGIIQEIEDRTNIGKRNITEDADLFSRFTSYVNNYYMRATEIIISADGTWAWDDSNQTDDPSATKNIKKGVSDYTVISKTPDTNQDWLRVERVNILTNGGVWITLKQRDSRNIDTPRNEREKTEGQPESFDFNGSQIIFDKKFDYDVDNGIECIFSRAPLLFAKKDTTKRPGFSSMFHEYLVIGPTYLWEKYKRVGDSEQTRRDLKEMEMEMKKHYGTRDKTKPNKLIRPYRSFR